MENEGAAYSCLRIVGGHDTCLDCFRASLQGNFEAWAHSKRGNDGAIVEYREWICIQVGVGRNRGMCSKYLKTILMVRNSF